LEIDAKGGEGALECLDLGGAHGFLMELIRFCFRLPLIFYFVLNFIGWTYVLYLAWIWLVICDELC
jgi:hypothetical protein